MLFVRTFKVHKFEKGLSFRDKEFVGLLNAGKYRYFDPFRKMRVDIANLRDPWLRHQELDIIARSGVLDGEAMMLDLKDADRALVWVDGRFDRVLGPGLHAAWTSFRNVRVEVINARESLRFEHAELNAILKIKASEDQLAVYTVQEGRQGVFLKDGEKLGVFGPGRYAFWKNLGVITMYQVDLRECVLDIAGQELMTADKVTLRINAMVTHKVVDAAQAVLSVDNWSAALYREAQLALRAVTGTRELDVLLSEKDAVARELHDILQPRAAEFGVKVLSLGIKDIILPGDMKELMNRVIEARKAAQANLISRQEETAAMRSQANTARLLESNPTLMRLKELEVLEKIAAGNKLNVVLGEKGLADRMMNLL